MYKGELENMNAFNVFLVSKFWLILSGRTKQGGFLREFRALTTVDDLVLTWVEDRAVVEFATELAEEYYYATRGGAAVVVALGFYFVGLDWLRKKVNYWGRAFSLGSEMAESKARKLSLYLSPVKKTKGA